MRLEAPAALADRTGGEGSARFPDLSAQAGEAHAGARTPGPLARGSIVADCDVGRAIPAVVHRDREPREPRGVAQRVRDALAADAEGEAGLGGVVRAHARLREGGKVLTVSETGYGRLSPISDYRIQYRGGKGLLNYHVDKYGDVAAIKVVDLDDDVILISADGVIIRIQADSIRECARPSKGVRVMRIGEDNKVVTLARAPHEEEDDGEELEGLENTEGGEEEIPDSAGDEEVQTPEE